MHRRKQRIASAARRRHAIKTGLILQRFTWRKKRVKQNFLGNHPDRQFGIARVTVDIEPPDLNLSAALRHQTGQDIDQGRFTGTIGPQQAENLTARNGEGHRVQSLLAARIDLAQSVDPDRRHRVHTSA